jgi:ethanolaminephosphotransferase
MVSTRATRRRSKTPEKKRTPAAKKKARAARSKMPAKKKEKRARSKTPAKKKAAAPQKRGKEEKREKKAKKKAAKIKTAAVPKSSTVLSPPPSPRRVTSVVPKQTRLRIGRPTLNLVDRSLLKQALNEYVYHSPRRTLLEGIYLVKFWDWVAEWYPVWLAPNMITTVGYLCSITGLGLVVWHSPNLDGRSPAWVQLACAVLLWIYQTADGSDGPQARRMRCGSALGELYDHGVDALVTSFIWAICLETAGLGLPYMLVPWTMAATQAAFFFSNITLLHTSVQLFNKMDAQEVQFSAQLMCLFTYFVKTYGFGEVPPHVAGEPQMAYPWFTPVSVPNALAPHIVGSPALTEILGAVTRGTETTIGMFALLAAGMLCAAGSNAATAIFQVWQSYRKGETPNEDVGVTGRGISAFWHQVNSYAIWVTLMAWGWHTCQPQAVSGASPYTNLCWWFVAAFGFADLANHLLVLRVAKLPFPSFGRSRAHWLMGTFILWNEMHARYGAELGLSPEAGDQGRALVALAGVVSHTYYSMTVGGAIAKELGVTFFTIPEAKQEAGRKKGFWG